jgi:hypothetical protein
VRQRRRLVCLVVAVPLVISAGCTGGKDDKQSSGSSSSSSSAGRTTTPESSPPPTSGGASPTDEQPPEANFPADTSDDSGPAQAGASSDPIGQMHVSGIRIASQQGYTRLVIDLTSHGVPAWTARYTEASGPGGGPVQIDGKAFLRVAVQTGADPGNQGQNDTKLSPGPVAEAKTTGFFEGSEEVLIGMREGETPFRAFALTDPGRIVIDVRPAG